MVDLLGCPFCGSSNVGFGRTGQRWQTVACNECGAEGPCTEIDRDLIIKKWNTRSPVVAAIRMPEWRDYAEKLDGFIGGSECSLALAAIIQILENIERALAVSSADGGCACKGTQMYQNMYENALKEIAALRAAPLGQSALASLSLTSQDGVRK